MYFCTLHVLNKNINREEAPIFQTILVGAMARASSTFCFMPFTILKTRFEVKTDFLLNRIMKCITVNTT